MAGSTTPAKRGTQENGVRPHETLMQDLANIAELDSANGGNFDIAAAAIDGIMQAQSLDDVFAANDAGPMSVKDSPYLNVPLNIIDVNWRKSAEQYRKAGLGVYVVIDGFLDNGEMVKLTCGAPNVVASLRKIQLLGLIREDNPCRLVIKGRVTENGVLLTVGKPAA